MKASTTTIKPSQLTFVQRLALYHISTGLPDKIKTVFKTTYYSLEERGLAKNWKLTKAGEAFVNNCRHPKEVNNLVDGKCGTCKIVAEWEDIARTADTLELRKAALALARFFRMGKAVYDTTGKSLSQHEEDFKKQQQQSEPTKGSNNGTHRPTAKSTARLKHRHVPQVRGHRKAQG